MIIAVANMQRGEHVLMPVFVDGTPERMRDWPQGFQDLDAIDAKGRGGLGAASAAILNRLRQLPASGTPAPSRPRTRRELLNAALHLDRSD